jgi:hypothetical protein
VESGQRQINAGDLYEISALLETSVGKLFSDQDGSSSSPIQSLNDLLSEVSGVSQNSASDLNSIIPHLPRSPVQEEEVVYPFP